MIRICQALMVVTGLLLATGPPAQADDLADEIVRAEAKWNATSAKAYTFTFTYGAMWRFADCESTKIDVAVEDDGQVTLSPCNDSLSIRETFGSVPRMFQYIRDEAAKHPEVIEVSFDPELGYPERFSLDYATNTTDDEFRFQITSLAVTARVDDDFSLVTNTHIQLYQMGIKKGCNDRGRSKGDPRESVLAICSCALQTLKSSLSFEEWQQAYFYSVRGMRAEEMQVMAPHLEKISNCRNNAP